MSCLPRFDRPKPRAADTSPGFAGAPPAPSGTNFHLESRQYIWKAAGAGQEQSGRISFTSNTSKAITSSNLEHFALDNGPRWYNDFVRRAPGGLSASPRAHRNASMQQPSRMEASTEHRLRETYQGQFELEDNHELFQRHDHHRGSSLRRFFKSLRPGSTPAHLMPSSNAGLFGDATAWVGLAQARRNVSGTLDPDNVASAVDLQDHAHPRAGLRWVCRSRHRAPTIRCSPLLEPFGPGGATCWPRATPALGCRVTQRPLPLRRRLSSTPGADTYYIGMGCAAIPPAGQGWPTQSRNSRNSWTSQASVCSI